MHTLTTVIFLAFIFQTKYLVFASRENELKLIELRSETDTICEVWSEFPSECEVAKKRLKEFKLKNGYLRNIGVRQESIKNFDSQLRESWEWSCAESDRFKLSSLKRNIQLKEEVDRQIVESKHLRKRLYKSIPSDFRNPSDSVITVPTPQRDMVTSGTVEFTIGSSTSSGRSNSFTNSTDQSSGNEVENIIQAGFSIHGISASGSKSWTSSESTNNLKSTSSTSSANSAHSMSDTQRTDTKNQIQIQPANITLNPLSKKTVTHNFYTTETITTYDIDFEIDGDVMAQALDFKYSNGHMCTLIISDGDTFPVHQFLRLRLTLADSGGPYIKFKDNKYTVNVEGKETIITNLFEAVYGKEESL